MAFKKFCVLALVAVCTVSFASAQGKAELLSGERELLSGEREESERHRERN